MKEGGEEERLYHTNMHETEKLSSGKKKGDKVVSFVFTFIST